MPSAGVFAPFSLVSLLYRGDSEKFSTGARNWRAVCIVTVVDAIPRERALAVFNSQPAYSISRSSVPAARASQLAAFPSGSHSQ